MPVSMPTAISSVRSYFDKQGWKYTFDEKDSVFKLAFGLKETKLNDVTIFVFVRPNTENNAACRAISSYGLIDLKADGSCMAQMCEYLTRANYGMTLGNFELDHRDGEIRFKIAFNCKDALPGEDAIDDLIGLPHWAFNRYGNGMLAISMGLQTAEEAYKATEK